MIRMLAHAYVEDYKRDMRIYKALKAEGILTKLEMFIPSMLKRFSTNRQEKISALPYVILLVMVASVFAIRIEK